MNINEFQFWGKNWKKIWKLIPILLCGQFKLSEVIYN